MKLKSYHIQPRPGEGLICPNCKHSTKHKAMSPCGKLWGTLLIERRSKISKEEKEYEMPHLIRLVWSDTTKITFYEQHRTLVEICNHFSIKPLEPSKVKGKRESYEIRT